MVIKRQSLFLNCIKGMKEPVLPWRVDSLVGPSVRVEAWSRSRCGLWSSTDPPATIPKPKI